MPVTSPKEISREEFLALFEKEVHPSINRIIDEADTHGIVCFENIDTSSRNLGDRTAVIYGPGRTSSHLEEILGRHLGDVPSRFQYPVFYFVKPTEVKPG